jgi:hypothetical protein
MRFPDSACVGAAGSTLANKKGSGAEKPKRDVRDMGLSSVATEKQTLQDFSNRQ